MIYFYFCNRQRDNYDTYKVLRSMILYFYCGVYDVFSILASGEEALVVQQ